MDERLKPAAELLTPEELARLSERARLDAQTGVRGRRRRAGEDLDDAAEELEQEQQYACFARGLTGLRYAARAYALRNEAAGLSPVVWGCWAASDDQWESHRAPDQMIAEAVASAGERVLEVPGLAERLARSPLPAVRLALAKALPASCASILAALAGDRDPGVRAAASKKVAAADE